MVLSSRIVAQPFLSDREWVEQLNLGGAFPEDLLGTRSVAFYSYSLSEKELKEAQDYFQRTGVDAVAYFTIDMLIAGVDVTKTFADYLLKREIKNLVFIEKIGANYRIAATPFNKKESIVDPGQPAWSVSNPSFSEALNVLHRSASAQLERQNMLISNTPELGLPIDVIRGKRNDFYAIDLKVDPLGVPAFGNEAMDKELEAIFATNYPYKYKLMEPGTTEKEMRKQGYLYVVRIIHTRGSVAKELLGYNTSNTESALVSVTYPDTQQEVKSIPSNVPVYKVYFKHIDSGNVFLGTKWDADLTWQQALLNNIRGMKAELRIN